MSRRLAEPTETFHFDFQGQQVIAVDGDTVASAMLANDIDIFSRSVKYHRPRGPWCFAGRCSHCLVRVDGKPNQFACMTKAQPDMKVSVQNVFLSAKHDLLESIDWLFPKGMDHHEMFAGVPIVEGAMQKVARHLAGLGLLPDEIALPDQKAEYRRCDVAIVGAGPAGLACALAVAKSGRTVEVLEERADVGGTLVAGLQSSADPDIVWARSTAAECEKAGARITTEACVVGLYREDPQPLLAVKLKNPDRLLVLHASEVVLCNGASEPLITYDDNDLPGTYAGRGLARLIRTKRVLPGRKAAVVGSTPEALALARLIDASGGTVVGVVDPESTLHSSDVKVFGGFRVKKARGRSHVTGLVLERGRDVEKLSCDFVALCDPPAPAIELARQAGAHVDFNSSRGGFYVATTDGRTSADHIYAAGEVTGNMTAAQAKETGAQVGAVIVSRAQRKEPA